jgi:hypothetical protein
VTVLLVPPHADVTVRAVTDGVAEVTEPGRQFVLNLVSDASRRDDGTRDIWLRAARIAISEGDPLLRLRALNVLLRNSHRPGDGVVVRLDDLELASGTTEELPDVLAAADAPGPYDAEVSAAVAEMDRSAGVRVVIDRDQQLPAALSAVSRLATTAPLEVTGRFAAQHWQRLRLARHLGEATLLARTNLRWRVAPEWSPPGVAVTWRERASDPVPAGRWAGRMSLRDVLRADEPAMARILGRAVTIVLGICGLTGGFIVGRGGSRVPAEALVRSLGSIRAMGVRPAAEIWLGAPGITADELRECTAALAGELRIAGFRVFDWPVPWRTSAWAGHTVTLARRPHDLSRRHEITSPQTIQAAELEALLPELAAAPQRGRDLVPGRVAGAYLWPPREGHFTAPLLLDEDVVVLPHPDGSRLAAVSFRTGAAVALPSDLLPVLGTGLGCGPRPAVPAEHSAISERFGRTVDKLVHTGILRRRQ